MSSEQKDKSWQSGKQAFQHFNEPLPVGLTTFAHSHPPSPFFLQLVDLCADSLLIYHVYCILAQDSRSCSNFNFKLSRSIFPFSRWSFKDDQNVFVKVKNLTKGLKKSTSMIHYVTQKLNIEH